MFYCNLTLGGRYGRKSKIAPNLESQSDFPTLGAEPAPVNNTWGAQSNTRWVPRLICRTLYLENRNAMYYKSSRQLADYVPSQIVLSTNLKYRISNDASVVIGNFLPI